MMHLKVLLGLCLLCFLVSSCVSKEKYEELEATLADTQTELVQKDQDVKKLSKKISNVQKLWHRPE
jgi:hypothetical protein